MMLNAMDQGATVSLSAQTQTENSLRFLFDYDNVDVEMRIETPEHQDFISVFQKVFLHSPAGTEEVEPYMNTDSGEVFVGHNFYHKESSSKDCEFFTVCPRTFELGITRTDRSMSHILAQLKKNDKIWLVTFGAPNSETVFMGKLWFASENFITTAGAMLQFDRESIYNIDLEFNENLNEIKAQLEMGPRDAPQKYQLHGRVEQSLDSQIDALFVTAIPDHTVTAAVSFVNSEERHSCAFDIDGLGKLLFI